MADDNNPIRRRNFLMGAGTAVAASLAPPVAAEAQTAPRRGQRVARTEPLLTLTETEHAFFVAAADTLIPADELSPSGSECGVVDFHRPPACRRLRRRRAALSRRAVRQGKPELGYQLPLNPREFFRAGIAAANEWSRKTYGKDFDRLAAADREAALKAMEAGKAEFSGLSSRMFFNALLQISMEGFFADPIYGGNRDMAAWKMVGYPGLPATYREDIKKYFGKKYDKPPRSIADFS